MCILVLEGRDDSLIFFKQETDHTNIWINTQPEPQKPLLSINLTKRSHKIRSNFCPTWRSIFVGVDPILIILSAFKFRNSQLGVPQN